MIGYTFFDTEHESDAKRAGLRHDDSPISVAFADPVLRAAGLDNNSYGEAKEFFDVSDWELQPHGMLLPLRCRGVGQGCCASRADDRVRHDASRGGRLGSPALGAMDRLDDRFHDTAHRLALRNDPGT
jgi:hypothetical protein